MRRDERGGSILGSDGHAVPPIVDTGVVATEGWSEVDGALERKFEFGNFVEALAFVNRVGALAEAENHHPDIAISYNRVTLRWWTHTAGGITERDRELAEKTSALSAG
jgi:4a-hydroxytetrahydrobiopterin dehydratase